MIGIRTTIAACLFTLLGATAQAAAPPPTGHALTADDLDAFFAGHMPLALGRGDIAGAVVVVVKDGHVLFEKGYGVSDVDKQTPVDPMTTMFRPGSVSKLFTWTAVMQLVEQHKLDLDADVNTYLDFTIPPAFGKPITLRNMMTHTPGFEETDKNLLHDRSEKSHPAGSSAEVVRLRRASSAGRSCRLFKLRRGTGGLHRPARFGRAVRATMSRITSLTPLGMTHSTFVQPLPKALRAVHVERLRQGVRQEAAAFELDPDGARGRACPPAATT